MERLAAYCVEPHDPPRFGRSGIAEVGDAQQRVWRHMLDDLIRDMPEHGLAPLIAKLAEALPNAAGSSTMFAASVMTRWRDRRCIIRYPLAKRHPLAKRR